MATNFRNSFGIAKYKRTEAIRQPDHQSGKICYKCRQKSTKGSYLKYKGMYLRWMCSDCDNRAINKILNILAGSK